MPTIQIRPDFTKNMRPQVFDTFVCEYDIDSLRLGFAMMPLELKDTFGAFVRDEKNADKTMNAVVLPDSAVQMTWTQAADIAANILTFIADNPGRSRIDPESLRRLREQAGRVADAEYEAAGEIGPDRIGLTS